MSALNRVFRKLKFPWRYLSWQITVASICFFCVLSPFLVCSLLPVNKLIHYASRSYFPGVTIQNNLKYTAINATQENCHICVPRHLGRLKICNWLKGDSIHCNGLHRRSIGKNHCLKMLFQANVRLILYISKASCIGWWHENIWFIQLLSLCSFISLSE